MTNFGTIEGVGDFGGGVYLGAGGHVTNGGGTNRAALIEGANGVVVEGDPSATISNFGTRLATGATGVGVILITGALNNGSLNNWGALIEGNTGVILQGSDSTNFGTIIGAGDTGGRGVSLGLTGSLINGAAGHAKATIEGFDGVHAYGINTVTNFGAIIGADGKAVTFDNAADTLIADAGCVFQGAIEGGGGTLKLDGGIGKLSGLFGAGGSVTVSGSMAATTFDDFATLRIGQAAAFTTSGNVSLTAGEVILNSGSLTLGGGKAGVTSAGLIEADRGTLAIKSAVANTGTLAAAGGTLSVTGAVTGTGSATIAGGVLDFQAAFTENVTFTGKTGTLELAQSQGYTGTVTGFSKAGGTSLDLDDVAFGGGTTATYSGNKSGGTLTVTDGTHTAHIALKGDYRTSTFIAASDGHGGTLVHDPAAPVTSWPPWIAPGTGQRFVAAMAVFGQRDASVAYLANHGSDARPAMLAGPRMAVV